MAPQVKPFKLHYVFRCKFRDGTHLFQTPDDVSAVDPKRSAFCDVVQRLAEVQTFSITNGRNTYLVDLRDGHFEVNGVKFYAAPPTGGTYELVYFRQRTEHFTLGLEHLASECYHHIGWRSGDRTETICVSNEP